MMGVSFARGAGVGVSGGEMAAACLRVLTLDISSYRVMVCWCAGNGQIGNLALVLFS